MNPSDAGGSRACRRRQTLLYFFSVSVFTIASSICEELQSVSPSRSTRSAFFPSKSRSSSPPPLAVNCHCSSFHHLSPSTTTSLRHLFLQPCLCRPLTIFAPRIVSPSIESPVPADLCPNLFAASSGFPPLPQPKYLDLIRRLKPPLLSILHVVQFAVPPVVCCLSRKMALNSCSRTARKEAVSQGTETKELAPPTTTNMYVSSFAFTSFPPPSNTPNTDTTNWCLVFVSRTPAAIILAYAQALHIPTNKPPSLLRQRATGLGNYCKSCALVLSLTHYVCFSLATMPSTGLLLRLKLLEKPVAYKIPINSNSPHSALGIRHSVVADDQLAQSQASHHSLISAFVAKELANRLAMHRAFELNSRRLTIQQDSLHSIRFIDAGSHVSDAHVNSSDISFLLNQFYVLSFHHIPLVSNSFVDCLVKGDFPELSVILG